MDATDYETSGSLSPLPVAYRRSQTALLVCGLLSLVTSGLLIAHITYGLIIWKVRDYQSQKIQPHQDANPITSESVDLSLGLSETHYYQTRKKAGAAAAEGGGEGEGEGGGGEEAEGGGGEEEEGEVDTEAAAADTPVLPRGPVERADTYQSILGSRPKPPNPLLLMIYNIIMSDIVLAATYINNAVWLVRDGIQVPSLTCHKQAWNVSFGSLVTSGFLFALSLFSYFGIIRGYKPPTKTVIAACIVVWGLSIFLASLPLIFVKSEDLYGRQTLWCWIAEPHKIWRLTVYCWGLITMGGTSILYTMIFYGLWREGRSSRFMPRRDASSLASTNRPRANESTPLRPSGHHPAFLVYPCIYMIAGTPLILGSLIPTLEKSPVYMGWSGAMLATTGLLDSILWSSIMLLSSKDDIRNTGLDHFAFMRTPEGRTLGNIVFVQGGTENWKRASWHSKKKHHHGWGRLGDRNSSQVSLPRQTVEGENQHGIQMDIITTVVVEGQGELFGMLSLPRDQPRDQSRDSGHEGGKSMGSPL